MLLGVSGGVDDPDRLVGDELADIWERGVGQPGTKRTHTTPQKVVKRRQIRLFTFFGPRV
jgi:hypothetical protein